MEHPLELLFDFQRFKVLNCYSFHTNGNGRNNYTLPVYYSEFHGLHIRQVYISIKSFSYFSTKINKVPNNNSGSFAIVVRIPTIQTAQFVELTYKPY